MKNIFISCVTKNVVETCNLISKNKKYKVHLIVSLNQINTNKKGYVFSSYKDLSKRINKDVIFGIDHFGYNSIKSKKYNYLIKNLKNSFDNGAKFLHVDLSMMKQTDYEFFLNKIKNFLKKNIIIELGFDKDGDRSNIKTYDKFLYIKNKFNLNINYLTYQTGTKFINNKNTSKINYKNTLKISNSIIKENKNLRLKEHNSDTKTKKHFAKLNKNFDFNIGPELAIIENSYYYQKAKNYCPKILEQFSLIIIKSNLWKKWCISKSSKKLKIISSMHYFFGNKIFNDIKKIVSLKEKKTIVELDLEIQKLISNRIFSKF